MGALFYENNSFGVIFILNFVSFFFSSWVYYTFNNVDDISFSDLVMYTTIFSLLFSFLQIMLI